MADGTAIEWTHAPGYKGVTWNPTTGCDQLSPGCDHCYALALARRLRRMGSPKYQHDGDPRTSGPGFGLTLHPGTLAAPLSWRQPRLVFVDSMSDLFHARVPKAFVGGVWNTMALTPQHRYQVLTKRPERMRRILSAWAANGWTWRKEDLIWCGPLSGPLPNVWCGTSIESDEYARRAGDLRETPAAVRFLSLEPLLGPLPSLSTEGIDWVIIGGESGPGARRLDLGWVRDLVAMCRGTGTAVFVKQVGSIAQRELRPRGPRHKGGDPADWPDDLRVREFPVTPARVPP